MQEKVILSVYTSMMDNLYLFFFPDIIAVRAGDFIKLEAGYDHLLFCYIRYANIFTKLKEYALKKQHAPATYKGA